jgi:hypothetical protein
MAITMSIEYPGGRGIARGYHTLTAYEIRHVRLRGGFVGLNITGGGTGKARGTLRMEIDEARILAAMLNEGADIAENAMTD